MADDPSAALAVVVPTFNERGNAGPFVEQLQAAFGGAPLRVVFADDSRDATTQEIRELTRRYPWVALNHSPARRGLARAVVDALADVPNDVVIVMDVDLQHPPLVAPRLAAAVRAGADLAVASRYAPGGRDLGLSGPWRRAVSKATSRAARLLVPAARRTTDPLSGFFAFRRSIVAGVELRPVGFKILLEILARGRARRVVDVPFTFERRARAVSKASMLEGLRFAYHLLRLRTS